MKIKKTPPLTAFLSASVFGVFAHLFGLVNIMHNYDDIAQQPGGYGTGITIGRWLLSILGDFSDKIGVGYNLPYLDGIVFLLLLGCAAAVLVSIFQLRSHLSAAAVGMLFAVFPSTFSTLVFRYTVTYYGVGIVCAVLAAWVVCRCRNPVLGLILSALLTAFSLGIYQAYVPLTIGIFVLLLIRQALADEPGTNVKTLFFRGLYYCATLLLGLALYFVFLKLSLALYGTALTDYQGVNEMGKISLSSLPQLVKEAVYYVLMLPLKDFCGISCSWILKLTYLVLGGVSLLLVAYLLMRRKNLAITLFTVILCLLFPLAVNFVVVMCPESYIYTIMVYSFVLIGCTPIILLECLPPHCVSWRQWLHKTRIVAGIAIALLIGSYAYQTQINYTALYYSNRQIENYLNSLVTQVRMTDGFRTDLEWAFIGDLEDPLLHCYWQYEMSFGGIEFTQPMLQRYSWASWIQNYYGYSLPFASEETVAALCETDAVKQMPCWPNAGSIQVLGDTVVIKCQELCLPD